MTPTRLSLPSRSCRLSRAAIGAAAALASAVAVPALAQKAGGGSSSPADGVVVIDQSRAMNGNVTAGDGAGFPVTISKPGHYRLTGNLVVPDAATHAIEVAADGVTIDLNGFGLYGQVACSYGSAQPASINCAPYTSSAGVNASARSMTTVRNGRVVGFGLGVNLGQLGVAEGLQVSHVSQQGITGQDSVMRDNLVAVSGGGAIGGTGTIRDNVTSMTRYTAIAGARQTLIVGNRVRWTDSFGINANQSGAAGTAHNVVADTTYAPINGGVSMGGNTCNGVAC